MSDAVQASPYHAGELAIQQLAGESAIAQRNGRVIGDTIPVRAIPFLSEQCWLVAASVDDGGAPWASILFGQPGFVSADRQGALVSLDVSQMYADRNDLFRSNIQTDGRAGLLAMDLLHRRRLRVNGRVRNGATGRLVVDVEEAYPNCPKYIRPRQFVGEVVAGSRGAKALVRTSESLHQDHREMVRAADTAFLASVNGVSEGEFSGRIDVSHRGGAPGFIDVADGTTLAIPDYRGNSMFNTLGNVQRNPVVGVTVFDFRTGRTIQVSGRAEVKFGVARHSSQGDETGRLLLVHVEHVRDWFATHFFPASIVESTASHSK